jgi:NADH-quinone oxidoreductase subunit C/D
VKTVGGSGTDGGPTSGGGPREATADAAVVGGDERTARDTSDPAALLDERFGDAVVPHATRDGMPTFWTSPDRVLEVIDHLRNGVPRPYRLLFDLTAVDDRARERSDGGPRRDFTVVYQLLSLERDADVRLKVPLDGDEPELPSLTPRWPAASWYEREVWDMFGIRFAGHPHLRRILMPPTWEGHPLRKDHPARATELPHFALPRERQDRELAALQFRPEDWGLERQSDDSEFLFLNVGPQHPGTHGVLRIILQLAGERIVDAVPDIGFHHRGAEKMGERQSWHTFIPYTDRIDYLGGVMNNLPYVLAVEKLAGIEVPERAQVIRIMLCEVFRIASHLVWFGTFAQDVGAISPVFYMFSDREKALGIIEAICGDRMHPNWFRIGGVAQDLPAGWDRLVRDFLDYMPRQLREYDRMVMRNRIFRDRTVGVGAYDRALAEAWGVTGPGLRATGLEWDLRKRRPYAGYDRFEFDVPTAEGGDCYARAEVRVEEIRQSLRIIAQCVENMPAGEYKADHPLTTPPRKPRTMQDIETLIHHFLSVSWGPVIPAGEAAVAVEASKGINSYYLISEKSVHPYRVRIRTPSFPHMQMLPEISRGHLVPDLLAILGSIDFVLADVDR